jgi:DNA replication protein DnaC
MTVAERAERPEDAREQLLHYLKELCLPSLRKRFAEEARRAERETHSYEQYLLNLVRTECEERRAKRLERLLRASRLLTSKDLASFDLKRLPLEVARQYQTLLDGSFVERRENVLIFGGTGTGKTHALCALGQELVRAGRRVYFRP